MTIQVGTKVKLVHESRDNDGNVVVQKGAIGTISKIISDTTVEVEFADVYLIVSNQFVKPLGTNHHLAATDFRLSDKVRLKEDFNQDGIAISGGSRGEITKILGDNGYEVEFEEAYIIVHESQVEAF